MKIKCFAYQNEHGIFKCRALEEKRCVDNCAFYKTEKEHKDSTERALNRLRPLAGQVDVAMQGQISMEV